jgi:hypothetical protein
MPITRTQLSEETLLACYYWMQPLQQNLGSAPGHRVDEPGEAGLAQRQLLAADPAAIADRDGGGRGGGVGDDDGAT